MTRNHFIGVDLGGTHLKVGVRKKDKLILDNFAIRQSLCGQSTEMVWDNVFKAIISVNGSVPQNTVIGLSMPGEMDNITGRCNCRRFKMIDFPFLQLFAAKGLEVVGINDAQASGLGELHYGAGTTFKDMLILTLGTGIGGAIVLNGQLLRASNNHAVGIVAHLSIDPTNGPKCYCGQRGCWGTLINRKRILSLANDHGLNCREVEEISTLAENDNRAKDVFKIVATDLAKGIIGLIDMLSPQAVVLSGGISKAGDLIIQPLNDIIQPTVRESRSVTIINSRLGNQASVLGATYLAEQGFNF